jgi:hypothetical protein
MLNFDDLDIVKLKIKDNVFEKNKISDMEKLKFYNSLYNKNDLSSYILIEKKPRKIKKKIKNKN